MSNICRLCYEEGEFKVQLNDIVQRFDQSYKELIEYYSRIELNPSDLLPQFVCEECRKTIEKTVEFFKMMEIVQMKLESFEAIEIEEVECIEGEIDKIENLDRLLGDEIQSSNILEPAYSKINNEMTVLEQYKAASDQENSILMKDENLNFKRKLRRKSTQKHEVNHKFDTIEKLFSDVIDGSSPYLSTLHINIDQNFKTDSTISDELASKEGISQLRWKDLLSCGLCFTDFSNIVDLNNHVELLHGTKNKAYQCKNCEHGYTALFDSSLINHHIERHHREHLKFCCLVCSKLFYDIPSLVIHYKKDCIVYNIMICYICGFYAKSMNELKNHKAYHIQMESCKSENQQLCETVLKKYIDGKETNLLNEEVELRERNFDGTVIAECQKKFEVDWSLLKQTCLIDSCRYKTSKPFELFVHLKLKHPKSSNQVKKIYCCNICSETKEFSGMHYFYNHMAEHHFSSLKFTCIVCSRLFWNSLSLALHYKNVHSSFTSVFCCHCGKIYHSITSAAIHYKKIMILLDDDEKKLIKEGKVDIEPSHICHICGKTCKNSYTLEKHLTTHEAADPTKMKQCGICGKLFNNKNKLSQHMIGHNNQRKWKCTICDMSFNFKKLLQMHIRAVHEFERTFQCNFCSKRFFKKYDLTVHVRLHTGFFPYTCPIEDCDAKYPAWSNLFKHCQSRHKLDIRSEGYKKLRASEQLQMDL